MSSSPSDTAPSPSAPKTFHASNDDGRLLRQEQRIDAIDDRLRVAENTQTQMVERLAHMPTRDEILWLFIKFTLGQAAFVAVLMGFAVSYLK